jgi:hypothetical protein
MQWQEPRRWWLPALLIAALFPVAAAPKPQRGVAVGRLVIQVHQGGRPVRGAAVVLRPTGASGATRADGTVTLPAPTSVDCSARACLTQRGSLYVGASPKLHPTSSKTVRITIALRKAPPKPPSRGPVRVTERRLLVKGRRYTIRGVGYEPTAIGAGPTGWHERPDEDKIYERDFPLLAAMHASTIRTWGEISARLLRRAQENRIRVIAGYWIDYEDALADPDTRARILASFRAYVSRFKNDPAMLAWSVGNEQNYRNGNNQAWYSLVNELAWTAYDEEGPAYHPVTTPNGELVNIGDPTKYASDRQLTYLDAWGINCYRGRSFGNLFEEYSVKSQKPLWISEYGIDAYDQLRKSENPRLQARYAAALWQEIAAARKVCIGGTIMHWVDGWWKNGNPERHDPGGFRLSAMPDGMADEEFWGVMTLTKNPSGVDRVHPREVYHTLRDLWARHAAQEQTARLKAAAPERRAP